MDFVEHFEIPTAICSEDLNLVEANSLFQELFSVKIGQSIEANFTAPQVKKMRRRLHRNQTYVCVILAHNERQTPYKLTIKASGEKIAILASDATDIKKSEDMLASYSKMIERQNKSIKRDKEKLEVLIGNILPSATILELRKSGQVKPKQFKNVGILMLDLVGFTKLSTQNDANVLFSELNELFTCFDILAEQYECERIKTIGDAYLAVTNVNIENAKPNESLAILAADFIHIIEARRGKIDWKCRIGLHKGDLIAGVVGKSKILFDVFGDGINTAARMEAASVPMKINCSENFYLTSNFKDQFTSRGLQEIKGKDPARMYFLKDSFHELDSDRISEIVQQARNMKSIVEITV